MNPTTVEPTSLQPPPQPPQPHRPSTSCERHPNQQFSGFCPSCLCERLSVLDPNNSPSHAHKTTASALRAIFRTTASRKNSNNDGNPSSSSGFLPELRRTKSFSDSKNNGEGVFSGCCEAQRKSCDVRERNNLRSLSSHDNERNSNADVSPHSFVRVRGEGRDGIALEERNVGGVEAEERVTEMEIIEEAEEGRKEGSLLEEQEARSMKDTIDLDSRAKKSSGRDFKDIAGSFWAAASVFSKKWQKWSRKQEIKKQEGGSRAAMLPVVKPAGRHFRETPSEISDYGFGRRSCDTDPRFSLDAARMSLDDTRHSFEMPRASWDGYLIGRSSFQRMHTIASLIESYPPPMRVLRTDMQIPAEMPAAMNSVNEDAATPGGSAQTRDYYLHSSSRRRKSLDRSNSIGETVVAELDELTLAMANLNHQGTRKVTARDKDSLRDLIQNLNNSNSLQDDCSEMFGLAFRENGSVIGNGNQKGMASKKSRRWGKGWNIWSFIHRRTGGGHIKGIENDSRYGRSNELFDRSYSESWQDQHDGEPDRRNKRILRSNSSMSYRNSTFNFVGPPLSDMRRNSFEANGKKRRDDLVLEHKQRARHSLNKVVDNRGMLRFGGKVSSRANHPAHSIAGSMPRLY